MAEERRPCTGARTGDPRLELLQRGLSHRLHAPESFNVMVAGRRGVGKSTFLQTMCDSFYSLKIEALSEGDKVMFPSESPHPEDPPDPSLSTTSPGLSAEEVLDPFCVFDSLSGSAEIRRCRVRIRDLNHHHPISVELVDTPGIDSFDEAAATATINSISREIERRLQATLDDEIRPQRSKMPPASHIHAVIYMLPPPVYSSAQTDSLSHRLDFAVNAISEIDVMAIRKLAQFANVILAVGKCDTMDKSERKVFEDPEFFTQAHDLIVPAKLYDFSDYPPNSARCELYRESREERAMARDMRKRVLRRLPFQVCGSKHVEEWQKMRLPEYQTSQSRVSVTDWRVLATEHNRICSSTAMITEGIFRDRRPATTNELLGNSTTDHRPRHAGRYHNDIMSSVHSLVTYSDIVTIKRLHQKRQVSLIRELCCGNLQITNPDHCNVALLIDLLFHSFRRSLEVWTDEHHYETYRMQRIAADPTYSAISVGIAEYLEAEKARRVVPKALVHPPAAPPAAQLPVSVSHSRSRSRSRRHTENGWSRSSAMMDGEPPAVAASTGRSNRSASYAANDDADKGNGNGGGAPALNNGAQFQYSFPHADISLASPPDTATTAPAPYQHQLRDHIAAANSKAVRNSHRTSAATTLTTIVTLSNPLAPPPSNMARRQSKSAPAEPKAAASAKSTRPFRFIFGARAEPALG
ncbi:Cell division control protein 11 [Coemansia sp. RSA 2530]|nr:Cell division control protein 11 [Coemansia sp. RSA 2530]